MPIVLSCKSKTLHSFFPAIKVGMSHIIKYISRAQNYTLTNNSKHGDAAVLQLDFPKSVERVLLPAVGHVERIPEAEGSLSTDLAAQIAGEGGGRGARDIASRRGKGGAACDDGGEYKGGLHLLVCLLLLRYKWQIFVLFKVAWFEFALLTF